MRKAQRAGWIGCNARAPSGRGEGFVRRRFAGSRTSANPGPPDVRIARSLAVWTSECRLMSFPGDNVVPISVREALPRSRNLRRFAGTISAEVTTTGGARSAARHEEYGERFGSAIRTPHRSPVKHQPHGRWASRPVSLRGPAPCAIERTLQSGRTSKGYDSETTLDQEPQAGTRRPRERDCTCHGRRARSAASAGQQRRAATAPSRAD
jgi:hypothetical protein